MKFTEDDLKEITDAVPIEEVAGGRSYLGNEQFLWKFANTPPQN